MKNSFFLVPALALAGFATLLALDIVNFEEGLAGETSQIDRWVMIVSFAGAAAFIGLASADSSSADEDVAGTSRAAAARKLGEGRPDPSELPSKPGSLLKQATERKEAPAAQEEPIEAEIAVEPVGALIPDALPTESIDPVDAELQSLIDDDQMQEINELVAAADAEVDIDIDAEEAGEIVPGSESVEPLARLELRLADYDDEDLKRVVKESESVVIAEMVRSGQLTSEGELTQKDIASMVFLAYTSEEMLTELRLRKSIDQESTGHPGLEASTGSDFAPLKNIE